MIWESRKAWLTFCTCIWRSSSTVIFVSLYSSDCDEYVFFWLFFNTSILCVMRLSSMIYMQDNCGLLKWPIPHEQGPCIMSVYECGRLDYSLIEITYIVCKFVHRQYIEYTCRTSLILLFLELFIRSSKDPAYIYCLNLWPFMNMVISLKD